MALRYRTRKRLSLLILILGLPLYIMAVWGIMGAMVDRPPIWLELLIYIGLGFLWALPFKFIFKGVGQTDPDLKEPDQPQ
ncbi:MAG: hypothetical protein A2092_03400 [Rhodobacteraceae bacterium GWE1_64_9]|nr:MAG: hypothetical protein A2092_03400 [Rhodobacteraceae bacterium GWE1_64_9]OHC49775.1 MAG: hypothetical protein A2X69_06040 [Rhodobacteraceae bacterium GWF1_65_7]HBD90053.1 DUF2842 domain-containing protein [Gemmobacter sp.]HBU15710.1 DUF2842 domain-containing protein [Gemmobacter sp.]